MYHVWDKEDRDLMLHYSINQMVSRKKDDLRFCTIALQPAVHFEWVVLISGQRSSQEKEKKERDELFFPFAATILFSGIKPVTALALLSYHPQIMFNFVVLRNAPENHKMVCFHAHFVTARLSWQIRKHHNISI
ncbi:hypothetical protein ACJX0J_029753 [Zea mays]